MQAAEDKPGGSQLKAEVIRADVQWGFAHRLLAPRTADGYNLLTVEGKLLLETLQREG